MYLTAPMWRGTSAVRNLPSAARIRRGRRGLGVVDLNSADPTQIPCSSVTVPAGFVGPVNCDPTNGAPTYSASASQLSSAFSDLQGQIDSLNANTGYGLGTVAVVGIGLFALVLAVKR